jgi:hypothetical protein
MVWVVMFSAIYFTDDLALPQGRAVAVESREDGWIETMVRGLCRIAQDVPEARADIYNLMLEVCVEERGV